MVGKALGRMGKSGTDCVYVKGDIGWFYQHELLRSRNNKRRMAAGARQMSSKPEVDNSWHERGELPPVGCECSAVCDGQWVTVEVLRHRVNNTGTNVAAVMSCASFNVFWAIDFRPLRTKREKEIEEMVAVISSMSILSVEGIAGKLYDSGYRKVNP